MKMHLIWKIIRKLRKKNFILFLIEGCRTTGKMWVQNRRGVVYPGPVQWNTPAKHNSMMFTQDNRETLGGTV